MKIDEIVNDIVSDWELTPSEALTELDDMIQKVSDCIKTFADMKIEIPVLSEIKEELENRKSWYE